MNSERSIGDLSALFTETLLRNGPRVAVVHRERSLTFSELKEQVENLEQVFVEAQVDVRELVGLQVPKSIEEYVAVLGLLCMQRRAVVLSPDSSPAQADGVIRRFSVCHFLVYESLATQYQTKDFVKVGCSGRFQLFKCRMASASPSWSGLGAAAWTLLTSGSTGEQKLVLISAENILTRSLGEIRDFSLTNRDSILSFLNASHDLGLNQILSCFLSGATMVVYKFIFMTDLIQTLLRFHVVGFSAVPSFWRFFLKSELENLPAEQLRFVTVSGGSLSPAELHQLRRILPHTDIIKTYGQTETFRSLLQHNPPGQPIDDLALGFPLPGVVLSLRDDGTLLHCGQGSMLGYYPLDESSVGLDTVVTGDTFQYDPTRGYRYLGRGDEMRKYYGVRFYPKQIEDVLLEHPSVIEVYVEVLAVEFREELVAAVAWRGSQTSAEVELKSFLHSRLQKSLLPTKILILSSLPKTGSGKVDRISLQREIQSFLLMKTSE